MVIRLRSHNKEEFAPTVLVLLYFITVFITYAISGGLLKQLPYRGVSILCVLYTVWDRLKRNDSHVNLIWVCYVVLCLVTGFLNYTVIHNVPIWYEIDCALFVPFVVDIMIRKRIHWRVMEMAVYLYAVFFIVFFLSNGLRQRVFEGYSNNTVSTIMLIPCVVFYAGADWRNEKYTIIPALITWVVSLLGRGRSGIGASSLLLFGLYFYDFFLKNRSEGRTRRSIAARFVLRAAILIAFAATIYYLYMRYAGDVLDKFMDRGVDDRGRVIMWWDYIQASFSSLVYFLLGVPFDETIIGRFFDNNPHNSFLLIHANNGILMLLMIVGMMVYATGKGIKLKKWPYLICLASFSFRSFFDMVFWGTKGTSSFLYLLFLSIMTQPVELKEDKRITNR